MNLLYNSLGPYFGCKATGKINTLLTNYLNYFNVYYTHNSMKNPGVILLENFFSIFFNFVPLPKSSTLLKIFLLILDEQFGGFTSLLSTRDL